MNKKIEDEDIKNDIRQIIEEEYEKHWLLIRKLILTNNGTEEDAEDIYQEAFIVLIENLRKEGFQLTCKISTYLYSVARRLWLNKLRKDKNLRDTSDFIEIELANDPEENDNSDDLPTHKAIIEAIMKLGSPCTEILISVYYEGLKMKELITQIPGLKNTNNARRRKFSCMKRLKKLLDLNKNNDP